MTGGHGTGAAFGKLMEDQYAFPGAVTLAMAAATFGLVSGGLIGGPVATRLIRRGLAPGTPAGAGRAPSAAVVASTVARRGDRHRSRRARRPPPTRCSRSSRSSSSRCGRAGCWRVARRGHVTLPAYIGAMIVAAVHPERGAEARRRARALRIEQRMVDDLGTIALSLFLSMALMSLRLWELLDLAIPMLVILVVQVTMMAPSPYFVTFRVMGRDYDAAVMAGGHCGFGLGATPNAVANMEALVERFGPRRAPSSWCRWSARSSSTSPTR